MSDFKLNKLNVTIKEVSFGNKKLTKPIFNQIEFGDCFNDQIDFTGDAIIGYVKDKDSRYLLWVTNGKLRRTGLTQYRELKTDIERASLEKAEWFLRKTKLKHDMADDYRDRLSEGLEEPERYVELVKKTKVFLDSLIDKQIYL
ncbi:MAG: hypothetical protein JWQ25_1887 [Daejeonella sp.]|nr:hypothetical protein [Daejeonella sp.]